VTARRRTAGVIIIGDEVLSGKVDEANAAFFVHRFRALGVTLARMTFIGDDLDEIAATVRTFSARYDFVCTTGGIGPTHDDLTVAGVARAFGRGVSEHPTLLALLDAHLGAAVTEGHRRMARVPEGAELVAGDGRWPTMKVDNVYIFPGVPALLARKFAAIEAAFVGTPLWLGELLAKADEAEICEALDAAVARHGDVAIGSYPQLNGKTWTLRLTAEAATAEAAAAALRDLAALLGERVLEVRAPAVTTRPAEAGKSR
jgi:molybdenum cofactor synthesis domain-containing protein